MCKTALAAKHANFQLSGISPNPTQPNQSRSAGTKGLLFQFSFCISTHNLVTKISSRGGLVVELWADNSLPSATVGSNLRQV